MEKLMMTMVGAAPTTAERISFFQCEILDASGARVGVVNTDAMAIALQNLGFAVLDTQKKENLSFGQALFMLKRGKMLRRDGWQQTDSVAMDEEQKVKVVIAAVSANIGCEYEPGWEDILATDWRLMN